MNMGNGMALPINSSAEAEISIVINSTVPIKSKTPIVTYKLADLFTDVMVVGKPTYIYSPGSVTIVQVFTGFLRSVLLEYIPIELDLYFTTNGDIAGGDAFSLDIGFEVRGLNFINRFFNPTFRATLCDKCESDLCRETEEERQLNQFLCEEQTQSSSYQSSCSFSIVSDEGTAL